jgi:hypothetical protein
MAFRVAVKAKNHLLAASELKVLFERRKVMETLRKRTLHGSAAVGWVSRIVRSKASVGVLEEFGGGLGVVHLFVVCKSYFVNQTRTFKKYTLQKENLKNIWEHLRITEKN